MDLWAESAVFGVTLATMLAGLLGLIIPVYPGMLIIWLAALGYGIVAEFGTLGAWMFGLITVLMLVGSLVDNVLGWVGAKQGGASWGTTTIGLVAGIAGTIALPPWGGILAAPLAILLLEYSRLRDWQAAFAALRGMALGWGAAYVIRLLMGLLMIGLWLIWAWPK